MNNDNLHILIHIRDSAAYLCSKLYDQDELEQCDRVMQEVAHLESLIRENYARVNRV